MSKKIHWITQQPTPYNDFLFNALAADKDVDLMVHFIHKQLDSHPWKDKGNIAYKFSIFKKIIGLDFELLKTAIFEKNNFIISGSWHEPTSILLLTILSLIGKPFAIWTDTPNISRNRNPIKAFLRSKWLAWVFHRSYRVMGTGKMALNALQEMGCPTDKLVNLPYIVNSNLFKHNSKDFSEDKKIVFLSSGRLLNKEKGYDLAVMALSKIKKKVGFTNFVYRIAGSGPDKGTIEALTQQLGIHDQVEFRGWLEQSELIDFYKSGHIFLHPAIFEPYGVAVIEAMAAGLIVIGSDQTGAVVDRLIDKENGLIHRANDVDDLVNKIEYVLCNINERSKLSCSAKLSSQEWPLSRAISLIKQIVL